MAMRKVFFDAEGIMLHHILRLYDKKSLLLYAGELQIRRVSKLKKDELAEKIANELLTPSVMRRRMAVFTPEQRVLFERAINAPFVPTPEEMDDALALHEEDYAFINKQNELNVPVDVAAAYEKLNTPEFNQYAKKMSWLSQCLYFGENFYGIFDKDVLLEIFNGRKGFHISIDELEQLCNEFPDDMGGCSIEAGQKIIIAEYVTYGEQYKELLEIQAGKDFYIPNSEQVLDYFKNLYLSSEPAYKNLRNFFCSEIGMSYENAEDETAWVWEKFQGEEDFQDIFQYLLDVCREALNEHKVKELVRLLQDANNNTRLLIHRGHTPNEMMLRDIKMGYFAKNPVVIPGSTNAANILKSASSELEALGIKVDLDSNATTLTAKYDDKNGGAGIKKVYPNDPCPCGSGKKFKKCCGKG